MNTGCHSTRHIVKHNLLPRTAFKLRSHPFRAAEQCTFRAKDAREKVLRRECCIRAKRVSKEEAAAGEWAALLQSNEGQAASSGSVTLEDLNQISNKGLKLMLNEDTKGLIGFQEELNVIGSSFSEQGDTDGALFIYVLWKMCDHVIVDQTVSLKGIYLDAFKRVFDILEDSGWVLVRENEEVDDKTLDDIPNLPYMQQL